VWKQSDQCIDAGSVIGLRSIPRKASIAAARKWGNKLALYVICNVKLRINVRVRDRAWENWVCIDLKDISFMEKRHHKAQLLVLGNQT